MRLSAIIKVFLLTAFIGFFTTPQIIYAHGHGNGNGNNGNGNGNGNGGSDGAGGDAVPISGLGILLIAGVAYTGIKVYNMNKVKESLV